MESPYHIKLSLAAAMQLGYSPARFHRAARMTCINLLLTYADGCAANCSYCGLARERQIEGDRSFIRVPWPTKPTDEVLGRIARSRAVKRTCLSMITHRRGVEDSIALTRSIAEVTAKPVSVLITPTLIEREDLVALRDAGADKIGVAFDLATEELFDAHRGHAARGPHRWDRYWEVFDLSVEVFGERMVGSHFIVGLGETERDMALAFQRVADRGGVNHLFSFFPEPGSTESDRVQPPMAIYRRMQLVCELIDAGLSRADAMHFDEGGRIADFGVAQATLDEVIDSGRAFRTRGCTGEDGEVACNRPYANSLPGDDTVRNFPFAPDAEDIRRIRAQMGLAPAEAAR
jgi:lipoyl synthase